MQWQQRRRLLQRLPQWLGSHHRRCCRRCWNRCCHCCYSEQVDLQDRGRFLGVNVISAAPAVILLIRTHSFLTNCVAHLDAIASRSTLSAVMYIHATTAAPLLS